MHGRPWKRCLLEGSILCSKISMYFSALMVPSQKCKLPLPRALTQPHTMTDPVGYPTLRFDCFSLSHSSIASVCCAAVRFVIVALLFIESLPYFHSVV